MYKLKLILADSDEKYLDKLTHFINSFCPAKLKVTVFTEPRPLVEYLQACRDNANILLAHPAFLEHVADLPHNIELILVLNDGSIMASDLPYGQVFKYQSGDQLVGQLLELYSAQNSSAARLISGTSKTTLISVFSPAGGTGKTSVALGLTGKLGSMGNKVFYLNLESINSAASVLASTDTDAFSYVLLDLTEDTLPLTIDKHKTFDAAFNMDFFGAPQCFREISALTPEGISTLLTSFRQTGRYDFVVIDLDSACDPKGLAVLEASDRVVLLESHSEVSRHKCQVFLSQAEKGGLGEKGSFIKKVVRVIKNTGDPGSTALVNTEPGTASVNTDGAFSLPYVTQLWLTQEGRYIFDPDGRFMEAMTELALTCSEDR